MATHINYYWRPQDTIWHVCGRLMRQAGYPDVPTFVRAVWRDNPTITHWKTVPAQTAIIIPYATH